MSEELLEEQELEQEIEEVVDEEPEENLEDEPETEEEPEDEEPPKKPQKKSDYVPLSKHMEVRNKLKETNARLAELEKTQIKAQAERDKQTIKQDLIARGWPEAEAEIQANSEIRRFIEMEEIKSKLVDSEIKELAMSDGYFSDALSYRGEIRAKMRQFNCDAETAYRLVRGTTRDREYKLEQEQRAAVKRRPAAQTKKVSTAAATAPKAQYKLDEADRKALAGLQKAMPDAGWDAKKYWETMKKE